MELELRQRTFALNVDLAFALEELVELEEQAEMELQGRFRRGGHLDLASCGDSVWLEQFRCVFIVEKGIILKY